MSVPVVPLDYVAQLFEQIKSNTDSILARLDVALSTRASEDTLAGIKAKTDKLTFDTSNYLYINIGADGVGLAKESTLSGIKAQTDKLLFDGDSYLYVNAGKVANPPNLDVALSTRASESTLSGIKSQTDKLKFDGNSYLYINAAIVANPPNLDVALSSRASESTLSSIKSQTDKLTFDVDNYLYVNVAKLVNPPNLDAPISSELSRKVRGIPLKVIIWDAQTIGTSEVISGVIDVGGYSKRVIWIKNDQDVDITVTVEGSLDGSNWYTIRSGITVPANGGQACLVNFQDNHAYLRLRAVASASPSSGSVTAKLHASL